MKRSRCVVLALSMLMSGVVFAASAIADEGSSHFVALLARAERDARTEAGDRYGAGMDRQFGERHGTTVGACIEAAGDQGSGAFQMVIVVSSDGRVSRVAVDPETPVSHCVRDALGSEVFARPPFAPFHDRIRLSFAPPPAGPSGR